MFRNQLIPNTENPKKTLIWRKQMPFGWGGNGGLRKIGEKQLLAHQMTTKIKFPIFMNFYSG